MGTTLTDVSQAVSGVVATAGPSVVAVGRSGSGAVVGEGLVLTSAHNLHGDLEVTFADGRAEQASVAGADIDGDLAVLRVGTAGAPPLTWAEGGTAALGQLVVGLSRPGGRSLRAGVGFVCGLELAFRGPEGRTITGALEHSALLPPGSSGGPLIDSEGRLAGINTHRPGEGTYLALPAGADLKARVSALAEGRQPRRLRLGVALTPPDVARRLRQAVGLAETEGLLVHDVDGSGPGGRGGVRRGDLIISVDGQPTGTVEDLSAVLGQANEARPLSVVVLRGTEEVLLSVSFNQVAGTAAPNGGAQEGTA